MDRRLDPEGQNAGQQPSGQVCGNGPAQMVAPAQTQGGEIEISRPYLGNYSFSLIEAIDRV